MVEDQYKKKKKLLTLWDFLHKFRKFNKKLGGLGASGGHN
jgi:hypothetical protein